MKARVLIVVAALALFDVVFVGHALARHRVPDVAASAAKPLAANVPEFAAQQFYPVMIVTTSRPLEIPGQVLEPGQYSFRLLTSGTEVAVARLDGSKSYGNLAIGPSWRRNGESGLLAVQKDAGGPNRLVSWFFPGQSDGYSFLYHAAR